MGARVALSGVAALLTLLAGPPQASADPMQAYPQGVGVPGCSDDVPVRASRELISFESRGRPIRAYLYTPRAEANGQAVVLLHGGTGFEMNSILFDAHAIQLASRGYRVLLPAYFDAAAPDPSRRTVTGRAWRQAALDAVDHLAVQSGVDPASVALWGYSRGAGVAVSAATAPEAPVRSVILAAGGGFVADDLTTPDLSALLLHARRDEAVPVRATLALAAALRGTGATVEVQPLDFDGHQYDLATWCDVFRRTRGFLDR